MDGISPSEALFYLFVFVIQVIIIVKFFNIASDVRGAAKDLKDLKMLVDRYIKAQGDNLQPPPLPETHNQQPEESSYSVLAEDEDQNENNKSTNGLFIVAAVGFVIIVVIVAVISAQ